MATIVPSYTDNIVLFKSKVANPGGNVLGNRYSVELDLTQKYGAILYIQVGREPSVDTAHVIQDLGLLISVRRLYSYSSIKLDHPSGNFFRIDNTPVTKATIVLGAAGSNFIITSTPLSCSPGEYVYFGVGTDPTYANFEVARIAAVSSTTIYFDAPLQFAHAFDFVYSHASILYPIYIDGGAIWRVVFDYGQSQQPDATAIVRCLAQTYNSDMEI